MQLLLECCYISMELQNGKIELISFVVRWIWYLRLVLQNILLIRSEHLSSPPVFSGIHVVRSLVF